MGSEVSPGQGAPRGRALLWMAPLLVALACLAAVLWSTSTYGLAVEPDSVVYLQSAEGLLAGRGLSYHGQPLTHFPPAYPALLAAVSRALGTAPWASARYVQAVLLGINVMLLAWLAGLASAGSGSVAAAALLMFALAYWTWDPHLRVVSEPLFLALTLACFCLLGLYLRQGRQRWLLAAALVAGLATVTRYVGVALIPPLLWAAWRYSSREKRTSSALAVLLCSGGPAGVWMARNLLLGQKATNRTIVYHPIPTERWRELQQAILEMALPGLELPSPLTTLLTLGLLALIALVIALWLRRETRPPDPVRPAARLNRLLLAFVVSYMAVLALSLCFFDASTNLTGRFVLIPFLALSVVAVSATHALAGDKRRTLWPVLLLCLLPFALRNAEVSGRLAREMHTVGGGYASVGWASSPTLAAVKALPPELILYSNASDAVEFVTGRQTAYLPRLYDPTSLVDNPDYRHDLELVWASCQEGRAVVVYLYQVPGRWQYGTREELLSLCPLGCLGEWSDGAILGRRQQ